MVIIIDYKDFFKSLEFAVDDYTTEAFDGYEKEDVEGLLSDRLKKGKERLICAGNIKHCVSLLQHRKTRMLT